jgi:DNA replication protein DnaC
MSEELKETLKKVAKNTYAASSQSSSSTDPPMGQDQWMAGDPSCQFCGGVGYVRMDLPIGHPDFGRVQVCACRRGEIADHMRHHLYSLSNLHKLDNLTFDTFEPRGRIGLGPQQADSLERAFNHARQFAEKQDGWLLIQGGYGCGKTHLAAAIANFSVSLGIPTLFITVPDLLDTLRYAYEDPNATFEQRFDEVRQSAILILDDFGTQNATEWAREKLFQIFNYRYVNQLPTVVTTNLALDEIEGRVQSRLRDPEMVAIARILAPDYRQPVDDTGHPDLSSLSLLTNKTFGNFNLRRNETIPTGDLRSLEKGFQAAKSFAEKPDGWLVLMGTYGSGKTHLAAAIANFQAGSGYPPLFVVVPDLLDHLRATFNPRTSVSYDHRFEEVRTTPLLILDDLGTQSMTPWVQEKLYQIFNYRYNAELPTVITTANTIDEIDPRIVSRMLDTRLCTIYAITVPSFRGGVRPPKRRR